MCPSCRTSISVVVRSDAKEIIDIRLHFVEEIKCIFFRNRRVFCSMLTDLENVLIVITELGENVWAL